VETECVHHLYASCRIRLSVQTAFRAVDPVPMIGRRAKALANYDNTCFCDRFFAFVLLREM
jgi:hypothetical protein